MDYIDCEIKPETKEDIYGIPYLYTGHIDYKKYDKIEKELTELFNKFGIDSITNTPDFILARMTLNFISNYINTRHNTEAWHKNEENE